MMPLATAPVSKPMTANAEVDQRPVAKGEKSNSEVKTFDDALKGDEAGQENTLQNEAVRENNHDSEKMDDNPQERSVTESNIIDADPLMEEVGLITIPAIQATVSSTSVQISEDAGSSDSSLRGGRESLNPSIIGNIVHTKSDNKVNRIDNMPLSLSSKQNSNIKSADVLNPQLQAANIRVEGEKNIDTSALNRVIDLKADARPDALMPKLSMKVENNPVIVLPDTRIDNLGKALQELARSGSSETVDQLNAQNTNSASRLALGSQNNNVIGMKTIEVQLLPKSLGLVQVTIEQLDGKLTLQIETQTTKAEAALKQESLKIIESIRAAGMLVEEVNIKRNGDLDTQDNSRSEPMFDQNDKHDFSKNENGFNSFSDQNDQNVLKNDTQLDGEIEDSKLSGENLRSGIYL